MHSTCHLIILQDSQFGSDFDTSEVEELLLDHGGHGEILVAGHNRLVVSMPIDKVKEVKEALAEHIEAFAEKGLREIDLPDPSGRKLSVNFCYHDNGQVCTANVDERLWAVMTAEDSPVTEGDAFVVLYEDVDISEGCSPADFDIQDVMMDVQLWDPQAARFDPALWHEDEPMATVTFTAQADLAGNAGTVTVDIPALGCSEISWEMPVRLVPAPDPRTHHDGLALLPCAPEAVRGWAGVAPFELRVEMPEPASEFSM